MTDDYSRTHRALQAMHADELPAIDPFDSQAAEAALIVDFATDEATENFKKLDTDTRGLRRGPSKTL